MLLRFCFFPISHSFHSEDFNVPGVQRRGPGDACSIGFVILFTKVCIHFLQMLNSLYALLLLTPIQKTSHTQEQCSTSTKAQLKI